MPQFNWPVRDSAWQPDSQAGPLGWFAAAAGRAPAAGAAAGAAAGRAGAGAGVGCAKPAAANKVAPVKAAAAEASKRMFWFSPWWKVGGEFEQVIVAESSAD
jgi:hypothetical protein